MLIFREGDQVTKSHAKAAYMVAFCFLRENGFRGKEGLTQHVVLYGS